MLRLRHTIFAALFLGFSAHSFAAGNPMDLRGEISRGETMIHRFDHNGAQYELRLLPAGGGWTIWIGDPAHRDHNYVAVTTPPFRGINPATIEGWHFRNLDNSGPNEPGGGNVNAPQTERHFFFVLDEAGYQKAQEALELVLRPAGHPKTEIKNAEHRLATLPHGEGTLNIDALELGNLTPGEKAHIERMAFHITLQLP